MDKNPFHLLPVSYVVIYHPSWSIFINDDHSNNHNNIPLIVSVIKVWDERYVSENVLLPSEQCVTIKSTASNSIPAAIIVAASDNETLKYMMQTNLNQLEEHE